MNFLQAIILGLVQGLAEYLPISSSGHLAVLQHFFGINGENVMSFTAMLHLGTLIAIFVVYRKDIAELILELISVIKDVATGKGLQVNKNETRHLGFMIIIATIPTAVIGLFLNDFFEGLYASMLFIGIGLMITGVCLYLAERYGGGDKGPMQSSFLSAFLIGLAQSFALCPGISRSGATMVGGLACRYTRPHAVRFAFLISIPSVLGAFILELPDAIGAIADTGAQMSPAAMIVGVLVAAVSGYAAIKIMIYVVVQQKLKYFSAYTLIAGLALVIYSIAS